MEDKYVAVEFQLGSIETTLEMARQSLSAKTIKELEEKIDTNVPQVVGHWLIFEDKNAGLNDSKNKQYTPLKFINTKEKIKIDLT